MGGCCCCCSSKRAAEVNSGPQYYYFPTASEDRVPLSSLHVASPGALLVDTNLDTAIPDAYRPPPAPMPFDAAIGHVQTQECTQDNTGNKNGGVVATAVSGSVQQIADANNQETSNKCEDIDKLDSKTDNKINFASVKEVEVELSKSVEHLDLAAEEEEDCPICLEEYDKENPKFTTNCEHDFHLACILQWMERSEVCPVCDKEITFELSNV